MAKIETAATCTVEVDGKEIKHRVSSVQLDQYIDSHHDLKVLLKLATEASEQHEFLEDPSYYTGFLGKSVSVTIAPEHGVVDNARIMKFVGMVTEIKLESSIDGLATIVIRGKSPTIALDGSPQVTYYEEQSAGDIISSTVSSYAITRGKMESTEGTIKYSVQYQETDYQYVNRLAEASGKFAYYDGQEFIVQKSNGSSVEDLSFRVTLGSFAMGLGTAPSKFTSKSWKYGEKSTLEGETDTGALRSSPSDLAKVAIDASKTVYGKPGYVSAAKVADQSGLDSVLGKNVEGQVGMMVKCDGESIVPAVKVGHCVRIQKVGALDGLYWVRSVSHRFDESGKYHNLFVCTPLDTSYPGRKMKRPALTNLQSAVVTDLDDPEGLGRIKVQIPALGIDTLWVRYLSPHAGDGHGLVCIPEVGDEVLIGYENGDPDLPLALGSLYTGKDKPPVSSDSKNEVKILQTKSGNQICFTDTGGSEEIKISLTDGKSCIVIKADGPLISIESDGDISIKGNNIKLESQAKIELKSGADMAIEAGANLKAKATANADIEASGQCNVKGAMINLN